MNRQGRRKMLFSSGRAEVVENGECRRRRRQDVPPRTDGAF